MERKKIMIIIITIIIILAIIVGTVYTSSIKDTSLSLKEDKIYKGDNLTFTLTDENKKPLVNENITVSIFEDNKTINYTLTTDDKGQAKLKIKLSEGNYSIEAKFNGNFILKSSSLNKKIMVVEKDNNTSDSKTNNKYIIGEKYSEGGHDIQYSNGEAEVWDPCGTYIHTYPNGKTYFRNPDGSEGYMDTDKVMG